MLTVNSWDEWSPLKCVIVGRADGARVPSEDRSLRAISYAQFKHDDKIPSGPYPQQVVDEANEDLDLMADQLTKQGIEVLRPEIFDLEKDDAQYLYCPRDSTLVVGDQVFATPMPIRARSFEAQYFRPLFKNLSNRYIEAPLVRRADESYEVEDVKPGVPTLKDLEPLFDAANVLRCGYDLFYLVSNSGNKKGAEWLQQTLGSQFKVHALSGIYSYMHIDSTISLLKPGLVLLNPERIKKDQIPEPFKKWKVLWSPEPEPMGYYGEYNNASKWIGMNLLMINSSLAVVEESQLSLIKMLEMNGIDVLPVRLRHQRTLGGGAHCVTLYLIRQGQAEHYF